MKQNWLYTLGELLSTEEKTVNTVTYEKDKENALFVHLTDGRVLEVTVKEA